MAKHKKTLKFLTINTHKLIAPFSRKYTLFDLKEALHLIDADIVFLQEMRGEHPKGRALPSASPIEYLAGKTWAHFTYAPNSTYKNGSHGNAVLSKFPILDSRNIDLTNHRREKRGLLWVEVDNPWLTEALHLGCAHLDLTEWGRKRQILKFIPEVHRTVDENKPLILAGDFNDWKKTAHLYLQHPKLLQAFDEAPKTFPSAQPLLSLDRIFYHGLSHSSARLITGAPWNKITDHLPLYAELDVA